MRITNNEITRSYTNSLQKNLSLLNYRSEQVYKDGRRFLSHADDPSAATRAMSIRRSLYRLEAYQDNVKTLQAKNQGAQGAAMQISERLKDVRDNYTVALNGTNNYSEQDIDLDAYASELRALLNEMITLCNTQYNGKYLLGGSNNSSPPVQYDETTGKVTYNGYDLNNLSGDDLQKLLNDSVFVDIGMGLQVDANGNVNPMSAFDSAYRAIDLIGHGEDNFISVLHDAIQSLENREPTQEILDRIIACGDQAALYLTNLGTDETYLEYTLDRLAGEKSTLTERQQALEFMEPDEAILNWKMQEYVYNAALQMGSRILQASLFNYIS